MSSEWQEILILLVYVSLLLELTVFHVPSVASTYQLFFYPVSGADGPLMRKVKAWPAVIKGLVLLFPTVVSVLLYLLPLLFVFCPESRQWLHVYESSGILPAAGWVLLFGGRFIAMFSVMEIRRSNAQKGDEFDLKTGGWFGFSRNPILIGMYVTYIGWLLIFPNMWMALGFILYFANMHFRILLEEDFLKKKFGEKFDRYMEKTRRYL